MTPQLSTTIMNRVHRGGEKRSTQTQAEFTLMAEAYDGRYRFSPRTGPINPCAAGSAADWVFLSSVPLA